MKAKLVQAQRDWERAQKIGPSEALSQNDYDSIKRTSKSPRPRRRGGSGGQAVAQAIVPPKRRSERRSGT